MVQQGVLLQLAYPWTVQLLIRRLHPRRGASCCRRPLLRQSAWPQCVIAPRVERLDPQSVRIGGATLWRTDELRTSSRCLSSAPRIQKNRN